MTKLVELMPLKPFVGSYPCSVSEADTIVDTYGENDQGEIVKRKQPRKRYTGFIPIARMMTPAEVEDAKAGRLPPNIVPSDDGSATCTVFPIPRTVEVPEEIARDLVARGLAERANKKLREKMTPEAAA